MCVTIGGKNENVSQDANREHSRLRVWGSNARLGLANRDKWLPHLEMAAHNPGHVSVRTACESLKVEPSNEREFSPRHRGDGIPQQQLTNSFGAPT